MSNKPTLTEVLRTAIERSGLTIYRIANGSGVPDANLRRFARGDMSMRLAAADRLAAFLGLHLVPDPDAVPPKPTPEDRARPMLAKRKPTRRQGKKRKAKG